MKKFLKSKSLSFIVTCMFMVTFIVPSINVYSEEMLSYLPTGFTNVAIEKIMLIMEMSILTKIQKY